MKDWLKKLPFMEWTSNDPVVPVLRLHGTIGMPASSFSRSLSLANQAAHIEAAFSVKNAKAVALQINSPGGSPVQSMQIHNRIRQLSEEKEIPVFAFAEDVAASGGYILALAADEIYADASSIIGSIGVISAGFGFDKMIEKIGVDRRVYTSGESKSILDPFRPENPDDISRLKEIQNEIHTSFIDLVRARRGDTLNDRDENLFSGAFWTGTKAKDLGLIDDLGDLRTLMRKRFGDDVKLKLIGARERWWSQKDQRVVGLRGLSLPSIQFSLADDALAAVEVRALWQRFGL